MPNPTSIPKVQTDDRNINQLQQNLSTALTPVLQNPIVNGIILKDVTLASGDNTINTGLGRKLQGWFLTRVNASTSVFDKQSTNTMPELTLILNSSAGALVDVYVFWQIIWLNS